MRRWHTSVRPSSSATARYLPRRPTAVTTAPSSSCATAVGSAGAVRRPSRMSTPTSSRPTSTFTSPRRTVSTSGSSGIDVSQQQRLTLGRRVADLEARGHRIQIGLAAGVHRRQRVAHLDAVAALAVHEHTDRVIDAVLLRGAAGSQPHHLLADAAGVTALNDTGAWRRHVDHERRPWQRGFGVATLRGHPALVALVRGTRVEGTANHRLV